MRLAAIALALSLPLLAASSARAAGPPPPEGAVHMKDGGLIRGGLLEVKPDDHVTVLLATGQTATIPWHLVDRIEGIASTAPPSALVVVPPPPRRTALVHIESDRPVRLEAATGKKSFDFVCQSPCDKEVDLDRRYRIGGDGVRNTSPFSIEAQPHQRVVIDVDTSSKGSFVGGIVLVSISPVVALIGLVVYAVSSITLDGSGGSDSGRTVGVVMGVGGLVGIVLGTVMIISSSSSKQSQSIAGPPPPGTPPARDAAREPIWHTGVVAPPAATTFEVPVLRF